MHLPTSPALPRHFPSSLLSLPCHPPLSFTGPHLS
ncbi:hypothetical protein E2C01_040983 [Portunus trituberculatus]|uniref:Uncharacterized protein n=1 Tax=Portunus trituberculatus TaxID=210409 RepID=A0A5B7FL75_PORTR|nr:hypothetical protein [Portunus trituberculatus]